MAQSTVTIGTQSSSSYYYGPTYVYSQSTTTKYAKYAYLFLASELNIPPGSTITQVEWIRSNAGTYTGTNNNLTLYMKNSTETNAMTDFIWNNMVSGATQVYNTTTQTSAGGVGTYDAFPMSSGFVYYGQSLQIMADWYFGGTTAVTSGINYYYTSTTTGRIAYYTSSTAIGGTTSLYSTSIRPTIRITYTPPAPCAGTPSGITVAGAPTGTVCAGKNIDLGLLGLSSGLTFQWQSSPNGTTWTNISGATNYTFSTKALQTMQYRCIATCTASTQSYTTPAVTVTTGAGTVLPYTESFENITANDELPTCWTRTNPTQCKTYVAASGSYNQFARSGSKYASFYYYPYPQNDTFYTQALQMTAGSTYEVSYWYITDGYGTTSNSMGELKLHYGRSPIKDSMTTFNTVTGPLNNIQYQQVTATFVAPTTGTYYIGFSRHNTSTHYYPIYLTFDDFRVRELAVCSGTPAGGTTTSTYDSVCVGQQFYLAISGAPSFMNAGYQWQYLNGSTWVDIPGAVVDNYGLTQTQNTQYRCKVTCNASGQVSYSAAKTVTMKNYNNCYCVPIQQYNCSLGDINNFTLTGINNTSINDLGTGCNSPGVRFNATATPVQLLRGGNHTGSISSSSTSTMIAKVWVDFNRDGIFDNNYENLTQISNAQNTAFNLTIPFFVDTGVYRMRIRSIYYYNTFSSCDAQSYGDTHDYMVNIRPCAVPNVNLGADQLLCAGASTTLNAGTYQNATYSWSTGATTSSINVNTAGTYRVTVNISGGCVARDTIIVTTGSLPTLTASNDTTACLGSTVTLSATSNGTVVWSNGATTPSITVNQAGAYVVTATTGQGCVKKDTVNFFYGNNAIVLLGSDVTECPSRPVVFNAGNPGSTYQWNNGATTQSISTTNAGTYTVKVTTPFGCEAFDTVVLNHKPLPEAAFGFAADGTIVSFTDSSLHGENMIWYFGDNSSSTQTNPIHSYVQYGTYTVRQVVVNQCGNDTATAIVGMYPTGVKNITKEKELSVYPNPTTGNFTIDNRSNAAIEGVTVTNTVGKTVYEAEVEKVKGQRTININLNGLASGVYFVNIKTEQGVIVKRLELINK